MMKSNWPTPKYQIFSAVLAFTLNKQKCFYFYECVNKLYTNNFLLVKCSLNLCHFNMNKAESSAVQVILAVGSTE